MLGKAFKKLFQPLVNLNFLGSVSFVSVPKFIRVSFLEIVKKVEVP